MRNKILYSVILSLIIISAIFSKLYNTEATSTKIINIETTNAEAIEKEISTEKVIINNTETEIVNITTINTTETFTETTSEVTSEITTMSSSVIINNEDNLYWLARAIDREASDVCSDEHKLWTGNVIINRVLNDRYPNTIKEVIFDKGQYDCIDKIYNEPSERSIEAANKLLNGDLVCDDVDVIFQAEFPQGQTTVKVIYNEYLDTYTYFCK